MVTPTSPKTGLWAKVIGSVAALKIITVLCICGAAPLHALETEAEENNLRAAIIAGILRYTYITGEDEPILCTLGEIPYKTQLYKAAKHLKINQKPTKVKLLNDINKLSECRVIVVGPLSHNHTSNHTYLLPKNTLVICDNFDPNHWLADVTLIRNLDLIAFNINLKPHPESIKFSANLLELAQEITRIAP